ncbi:hypothetical protein CJ263_03655 [Maribacter cobaltidurans]|uniref:Thioredoxin domain-containing protein n=2 Tax=Maribacter cobaltidurans TaxID=1178778 RepID=A0A223V204_9FLAO|nr:hypothetical protein CJ263_03655 [Maribacter cobaltidurans]
MSRVLLILLFINTLCHSQEKSSMDSLHSMHFSPTSPVHPASDINDSINRVQQVNREDFSILKENNIDKPMVLIFLGSDCPISQKYGNTIRNLYALYKDSVNFYGIFPENFKDSEIIDFKKIYQIEFDLISDKNNELAKQLKASHTPQTYLINPSGKVLYQGAIDNWFYALGKNRRQVTKHYLENAIKSVLQGTPVKVTYTQAIGCFIEYKD